MGGDIVFIVSSAIYLSDNLLHYDCVRSIYTPEERALQTKEGIESIRRAVPNSKVILTEVGQKRDLPLDIEKLADRYVYGGGNPAIRRIADSKKKNHGEAVSLLIADQAVKEFQASYFFKMSGRYKLNERFSLLNFTRHQDCMVAMKYNEGCMSTRLYGFPAALYGAWRAALFKAIPDLRFGWAIENTIPKVFPRITHLSPIGLSGLIGPNGCGVIE